jgi:hypothetical protein
MLTYKGGQKVGKGTYWDLKNGRRIDVTDEDVLPGERTSTYLRMPSGVMLLTGPVIGLVYVIFLPFIGIAVVATVAGRKLVEGMANLIGKSLSFGWRPKNAYLSGKKKEKSREKHDKS